MDNDGSVRVSNSPSDPLYPAYAPFFLFPPKYLEVRGEASEPYLDQDEDCPSDLSFYPIPPTPTPDSEDTNDSDDEDDSDEDEDSSDDEVRRRIR